MSTTMTEAEAITEELDHTRQIEELRERRALSRKARRAIPRPTTALDGAREAVREARAKVHRLEGDRAEATALLDSLNGRLDRGDESVTTAAIVEAEKDIERVGRLLKPATQEARRAERALAPLEADDHLANLVADALEQTTDVPVVIRKSADDAPDIAPIITVSQIVPTEGYGTLDASGEVRLNSTGEKIDTEALADVLKGWGSELRVTATGVVFDRAAWEIPRLAKPSPHAVADLMQGFARAWGMQVAGASEVARLRELGYINATNSNARWGGLFKRGDDSLTYDDGEAVGTAPFLVAAQHERGESMPVDELRDELATLVGIFQDAVGGISEAGEIVSITLGEVVTYEGDERPWARQDVAYIRGESVWPITAAATLEVVYRYDPAGEV